MESEEEEEKEEEVEEDEEKEESMLEEGIACYRSADDDTSGRGGPKEGRLRDPSPCWTSDQRERKRGKERGPSRSSAQQTE